MNNQDAISKAVKKGLSIAIASSLIIFGFVFTLMVKDDLFSVVRFEKALNTTGSYFGGVATLVAAYIASMIYVDWKKQTKYPYELKNISSMIIKVKKLTSQIINIRANNNNALFLTDYFEYIVNKKDSPTYTYTFDIPDFTEIKNTLNDLDELSVLLSVYSSSKEDMEFSDLVYALSTSLGIWMDDYSKLKNILTTSFVKDTNQTNYYLDIFCNCCSSFYEMNIHALGEYGIYNHNELDIFYDQMAVLVSLTDYLKEID